MLCAHCGKKIRAADQECIYLRWSKGRNPHLEEYGLHRSCEMKYNTGESFMTIPDVPFEPFPKLSRLMRDITITEKIDGTNAGILIGYEDETDRHPLIHASSRTRWITPENDNFGFAHWVEENKETLIADLGEGMHFGEWWGQKIQRTYGLTEKRFSLFNTRQWAAKNGHFETAGVASTPVLYEGPFTFETGMDDTRTVLPWIEAAKLLKRDGSRAAPGFMNPEGIVVYFSAARQAFKYTLNGDGHKGSDAHS